MAKKVIYGIIAGLLLLLVGGYILPEYGQADTLEEVISPITGLKEGEIDVVTVPRTDPNTLVQMCTVLHLLENKPPLPPAVVLAEPKPGCGVARATHDSNGNEVFECRIITFEDMEEMALNFCRMHRDRWQDSRATPV